MTKEFLTIEECKEQGLEYIEYWEKGVYKYKNKDGLWTLIEHGVELISDVDSIIFFGKDTYSYKKGGEYTLIEHGVELFSGCVDYVQWLEKGVYYYTKDMKYTLIEHGVELISDVKYVHWYQKGVYEYKKDCKWTLIEHGKELISGADSVMWYQKGVYRYRKDGKLIKVTNGKEYRKQMIEKIKSIIMGLAILSGIITACLSTAVLTSWLIYSTTGINHEILFPIGLMVLPVLVCTYFIGDVIRSYKR